MKYIISLIWSFIFAFVVVFIVSSILGTNGEVNTLRDCAILSILFTGFVALLDAVGLDKKRKED
ncbi:DUF2929 family protein [uncultured Gemella sp.]|uniref:DUF2929 family protein n=1 Tax=uncultured Gemella sp. TaxID=254352 RepID=UPI0028D5BB12|nr:DUF2929 family protein [uncultured Gemella sp.]